MKGTIKQKLNFLQEHCNVEIQVRDKEIYQIRGSGEICLARLDLQEEVGAFLLGYMAGLIGDNISYWLSRKGDTVEYFDTPGTPECW